MDAKQVWRAALGELQVTLSPANFETWLRDTALVDVDDTRFRIAVPNGFAKDWLESRYRSLISQTLGRIVGYGVQVDFVVGPVEADAATPGAEDGGSPRDGSDAAPIGATPQPVAVGPGPSPGMLPRPGDAPQSRATVMQQVRVEPGRVGGEGGATYINTRYTFANFIVGSANRLAHAASL